VTSRVSDGGCCVWCRWWGRRAVRAVDFCCSSPPPRRAPVRRWRHLWRHRPRLWQCVHVTVRQMTTVTSVHISAARTDVISTVARQWDSFTTVKCITSTTIVINTYYNILSYILLSYHTLLTSDSTVQNGFQKYFRLLSTVLQTD